MPSGNSGELEALAGLTQIGQGDDVRESEVEDSDEEGGELETPSGAGDEAELEADQEDEEALDDEPAHTEPSSGNHFRVKRIAKSGLKIKGQKELFLPIQCLDASVDTSKMTTVIFNGVSYYGVAGSEALPYLEIRPVTTVKTTL